MKTFISFFAFLVCLYGQTSGQVSFGVRLGICPATNPRTNHLIANRHDPAKEFLFNIERVEFSPQAGLMFRTENKHFWFMIEAMFCRSTSTYSVIPTLNGNGHSVAEAERQTTYAYHEKTGFVDLPFSAGVKLGRFEIFSGVHATMEISSDSELARHPEFVRSMAFSKFGWHSGIGINFCKVLVDFRYQQQFSNYGQGLFVSKQEVILKNAPTRFTASVAYRF